MTFRHVLAALWAGLLGCCVAVDAAHADPMALGLVVKMKDHVSAARASAGATSVVRLAPSRLPADGAAAHAQRLSALLSRKGIRHQGQRPTAYAARVVRFDQPRKLADAQAMAASLRQDPDVEWVMVDEVLHAASVSAQPISSDGPNDTAYAQQAWLQPRLGLPSRAGLADVPAAWARIQGRMLTPVTVAVLDSGVLPADDLVGRLWPGYDFVSTPALARDGDGLDPDPLDEGDSFTDDDRKNLPANVGADCVLNSISNWHGLTVTYMLAAGTDNGQDGAGILAPLPGAVVLPVRVAGACGAALSDLIEGMLWSAGIGYQGSPAANPNPARVINVSFGSSGACNEPQVGSTGWMFRQTIAALKAKGVLLVASAGNGDASTHVGLADATLPANCAGVLAVTGLDMLGHKAGYANLIAPQSGRYGLAVASGDTQWVDGQAYLLNHDGVEDGIMTLTNVGTTAPVLGVSGAFEMKNRFVGTSFAAPQAAGVAALMLAVDPDLTVDELLQAITDPAQVRVFPTVAGPDGVTPYPTCTAGDAATSASTGYCNCTAATCGSGVLDAGLAVDWAARDADLRSGTTVAASDAVAINTGYFTPQRGDAQPSSTSAGSGGGGGGAVDMLALMAMGLWVALVGAMSWQRRRGMRAQDRQATKPLS